MHGPRSSLARAWYRLTTRRHLEEWSSPYGEQRGAERAVPCRRCPKLDARNERCRVPFGSPLRKCVVAATEAHLRDSRGRRVLELGYARRSYGKRIVELTGGSWTGVEPLVERNRVPQLGTGGYGHAGEIPFPDATFDTVFGNQSFEHWEEPLPDGTPSPSYAACLKEVHRVLRPGGSLYLDAPIHLHGHEMFVAGDVARIVGLFSPDLWRDVAVERWREDYAPLQRYPAPPADIGYVSGKIVSYDERAIAALQADGSVWLLVVTAVKR